MPETDVATTVIVFTMKIADRITISCQSWPAPLCHIMAMDLWIMVGKFSELLSIRLAHEVEVLGMGQWNHLHGLPPHSEPLAILGHGSELAD